MRPRTSLCVLDAGLDKASVTQRAIEAVTQAHHRDPSLVVHVVGNIASGKTTLLAQLQHHFPAACYVAEPLDEWSTSLEHMYQRQIRMAVFQGVTSTTVGCAMLRALRQAPSMTGPVRAPPLEADTGSPVAQIP